MTRPQTRRRTTRTQPLPTSNTPPDHMGLLAGAMVLIVIGWVGLFIVVNNNLPRIGGELWSFFMLLQIAITGTVLPIIRFFNVRFTPVNREVPPSGVIVRQSVWVGLYVVTCAWLQIPRVLSLPLALFLIVVFVVVEVFIRTRELADERDY